MRGLWKSDRSLEQERRSSGFLVLFLPSQHLCLLIIRAGLGCGSLYGCAVIFCGGFVVGFDSFGFEDEVLGSLGY